MKDSKDTEAEKPKPWNPLQKRPSMTLQKNIKSLVQDLYFVNIP